MIFAAQHVFRRMILGMFLLGIALAIVAPIATHSGCGRPQKCASNLAQLYRMATLYASCNQGRWPISKAENFCFALARMTPPNIEAGVREGLPACPVRDEPLDPDGCDYLGPTIPWNQPAGLDAVLADKPFNHGPLQSINVVLKNGAVNEALPDEPLWKRCIEVFGP